MVSRGGVVCTGKYFLKNLLLRAINVDNLLANFDHYSRVVPFSGVGASLVLDAHMVANCQGWESLDALRPSLGSFHVVVSQSFLSCG